MVVDIDHTQLGKELAADIVVVNMGFDIVVAVAAVVDIEFGGIQDSELDWRGWYF